MGRNEGKEREGRRKDIMGEAVMKEKGRSEIEREKERNKEKEREEKGESKRDGEKQGLNLAKLTQHHLKIDDEIKEKEERERETTDAGIKGDQEEEDD